MSFKKDFAWGAATASFQIEGAAYSDGKGLSIWDTFCKQEGKIFESHNGDIACDHYNRFLEDIKLMKEMGLKAYRFSVNWPRIMPNGTGEVNEKGLEFYHKLIDALNENGIEPYMTLYHWELPYELHKRGGWLNPEIVNWFRDFATLIAKEFSSKVKNFITLNEPQVFVGLGYQQGEHAPGYKLPPFEILQIGHNVLKAHGAAVKALRENAVQSVKIGIALAVGPIIPVNETPEEIKAATEAYGVASREGFVWSSSYWLDPIVFGKYNENILNTCKDILPVITEDDLKLISQPIDFTGANIYRGNYITVDQEGNLVNVPNKIGYARTSINWMITNEALYWGARQACERYNLPYIITENGMAAHDAVSLDGEVHDPNRIDLMNRYLLGLKRAADEGYDCAGYFAWSLMDNFEWGMGYNERFGLIYVDYETQKRIIKDSGKWYKTIIESNGEKL